MENLCTVSFPILFVFFTDCRREERISENSDPRPWRYNDPSERTRNRVHKRVEKTRSQDQFTTYSSVHSRPSENNTLELKKKKNFWKTIGRTNFHKCRPYKCLTYSRVIVRTSRSIYDVIYTYVNRILLNGKITPRYSGASYKYFIIAYLARAK